MKIHANARTCPNSRKLLVKRIEDLPPEDRATVERVIVLLRNLADAEV